MPVTVHSVETMGTHEGPGIRLVLFLQGCHFRCLYCHNPDTWSTQDGKVMSDDQIFTLLNQQKTYLRNGGLTVSGGEPLIQRIQLTPIFEQAQAQGIHTALDTNGSILDEFTKKLLAFTDLVLLDIKHIDNQFHQKLTGQSNKNVLAFAEYLSEINKPTWLRYVLVPGWTNQREALHEWGTQLQHFTNVERVEILPFHTLGAYKYEALGLANPLAGLKPPTADEINEAKTIFEAYFQKVMVR